MRRVIGVGGVFLALAYAAWAGDIDAKKIVGRWTLQKKDVAAGAVEFTKDGKLHVRTKDATINGAYEVSKDMITLSFEKDGKKETKMGTIEKLTADTLVIQPAEGGDKVEFRREKKKEE